MVRYLDRHYDPSLAVRDDVKIEDIEVGERLRLASLVAALRYASGMKRRLGNVPRDEAARDKQVIRRLEHAFYNSLIGWCEPDLVVAIPESSDTARKRGATTDWENWASDHILWLDTRLQYMATYAKKTNQPKWGCRAVVRLENEQGWTRYALR